MSQKLNYGWRIGLGTIIVCLGIDLADARKVPIAGLKGAIVAQASSNDKTSKVEDAKHVSTGKKEPEKDPSFAEYAIFEDASSRAELTTPRATSMPLKLSRGDRIAFVGNTLFDRDRLFGHFETLIHQNHAHLELTVRNLAWSADEVDLQPRPDNFGDLDQHLAAVEADVIFAAFGFNESFAGIEAIPEFKERLRGFIKHTVSRAYNGSTGPQLILLSPVANENVEGVAAADLNNGRLAAYTRAIKEIARKEEVGFIDVFSATRYAMDDRSTDLTFNGAHMLEEGYRVFAKAAYEKTFGEELAPEVNERIREVVIDKNEHFFYR